MDALYELAPAEIAVAVGVHSEQYAHNLLLLAQHQFARRGRQLSESPRSQGLTRAHVPCPCPYYMYNMCHVCHVVLGERRRGASGA